MVYWSSPDLGETFEDQFQIVHRQSWILIPDDIVLTDCGTAQLGMFEAVLSKNATTITSLFWSSIRYAGDACLGACLAAKTQSPDSRVILIAVNLSLQMKVLEISTHIRNGLTPTIFVVNNDGYSIERAIHGAEIDYNDINTSWDYQGLLKFFGARPEAGLCEIVLDKFDYPWRLATQIEMVLGQPLEKQLKVGAHSEANGHLAEVPTKLGRVENEQEPLALR